MRTALIIIALLIGIAVFAGWVSFNDRGDTASIELDKQEAREETQVAVETVGEVVEDTVDSIERQFDSDEDEVEVDETATHNSQTHGEESTQSVAP